jgi:hypothetical protein
MPISDQNEKIRKDVFKFAGWEGWTDINTGIAVLELQIPAGGRYVVDGYIELDNPSAGDKITAMEIVVGDQVVDSYFDRGVPLEHQFKPFRRGVATIENFGPPVALQEGWLLRVVVQKGIPAKDYVSGEIRWLIPTS